MASESHKLLNYLRVMVGVWRDDPRDDATLLARFTHDRDEAAFTALVGRHGALVWGTCRRILGDTPDAEDAFQATFITLASKAGRFPIERLAGWLHQVARQTAINVRSKSRRSLDLGRRLRAVTQTEQEDSPPDRTELYAVLDEELAALAERLRVPLMLRHLEGKTLEEVARIIGCSRRDLSRRLLRGETILRQRLERRGLSVGAWSLAALVGGASAASAIPSPLVHSTVKAALSSTPAPVAAGLANGALQIFGLGKAAPVVLGVLAIGTLLAGAGVWAYQQRNTEPTYAETSPAAKSLPVAAAREKPRRPESGRLDLFGAPLPEHAIARMGMARLRHAGPVSSVAVAPGGETIASASFDKTARLWDADSGKELRKLQGHDKEVTAVAYSPDGKTLASASADRTICLWDAATGEKLRRLQGHQQPVLAVAFSPDGKELASASFDQSVRLWGVAAGRELHRLKGHTDRVFTVAFSVDGQTVASGGADQSVRLWNARSGQETGKLEGHKGTVAAVVFSPDGKTLASGGTDKTIRLWDVAAGQELRKLSGHQEAVSALAFAADGQTLASGSYDWTTRIWDVNAGAQLRSLVSHYGRHTHLGPVSALAFSGDGKSLISAGHDGAVRSWELATGTQLRNWEGHQERIGSVFFSPDGKTLASASMDNTVRLWDAATGKQLRQLDGPVDSVFNTAALSPDGKTLATGSHDKSIHLWDPATGKAVRKLLGHTGEATAVAFTPDGQTLASGSSDQTIRFWDVATGEELSLWKTRAWVVKLAFSPDGKILALVEWGQPIALRDVATGREIGKLQGHQKNVMSVAFSPDGKTLASASWDGSVRVWEVATAKEVLKLEGHGDRAVLCVAIAPRGRYVASGGWDGTVRLWELASGRECARFSGHEGDVCSLAFSPDGRRLASSGGDHTMLIWDLTGRSRRPAPAARMGSEELERLWSDLASDDAARAYRAGWALVSVPNQAVDLFRRRLRGSLKLAEPLRSILGKDAANFPGLEATSEPVKPPMSEELRIVRAVAVLEEMGSVKAKELLREVAERAQEAQTGIDRELGRRP